jgi:gluconate 2-dehydrogenase gamma chain
LDAVADRIFPADEHGPGAVAVGATEAAMRALDGGPSPQKERVVAVLESLGDRFPERPATEQDAALASLAETDPQGFEMIRTLVLEGLFGDPSHGGNIDGAGWRMLGYPGPRPVVPAEDQQIRGVA